MQRSRLFPIVVLMLCLVPGLSAAPQKKPVVNPIDARLEKLKTEAAAEVDNLKDLTQQMVDEVFSYGEPGFQEIESSKYTSGILEKNGFTVVRGNSGMPTSWVATWGSGKPKIAIGSDIDSLLEQNQKPAIPRHEPFVVSDAGVPAPGHGEGHNTGVPLSITAAIAVKKIMEREKLPGTLMVWPGIAEELLAGKAWLVRDGVFKDVDMCLFNHIGSDYGVGWGPQGSNGLVAVEYSFKGITSHSGSSPWLGRSALDAVLLTDVGINFRREHMPLSQRTHMIITSGGSQPNVVPGTASMWYCLRQRTRDEIQELWDTANAIAKGAAMMTGTDVNIRLLNQAYPRHMNKVCAETVYANIKRVGIPKWDDADQALAKMQQRMMKGPERGLTSQIGEMGGPTPLERNYGGGSDDIGDISWAVPTCTLNYPGNVPGMQGHHWSSAIAEATPIAHKGVTAGAKVQAMTMLDLLLKPEIVKQAWDYYTNVQTKTEKYRPFITAKDVPPIWLNDKANKEYREKLKPFYFNPTKFKTYLEQLGIPYPPPPNTPLGTDLK